MFREPLRSGPPRSVSCSIDLGPVLRSTRNMAGRQPKLPPRGGRNPSRDLTARTRADQVQRATYRIAEAAHTAPTLLDLFRAIHGIVGELMPAKNFYIALHDATSDIVAFPSFV